MAVTASNRLAMKCYLLTGGRSTRMGTDKASLLLGGRSFLDRVLTACAPVFREVIPVSRAGTEESSPVRAIFEPEHDGEAAVFGVIRALGDAGERCFVLAVDYPLVTSALLAGLASRFAASAAPMLIPVWDGRPQPLCGGYDPVILPLLRRRVAEARYDFRTLADEAGALVAGEAELRRAHEGEPLLNVNTPEELNRARRIHEHKRLLAPR